MAKKQLNILCFIDSLGSGGAQRQLVELAKGFKEKGHSVSFLVYHHEPFFLPELVNFNIPYSCIEEDNYLKRIIKIRRFIRNGNYDAVLSFLEAANFIATISGFPFRKWKLVVGERSANPRILKSPKLWLYRYFHFFANFIVANSHENIKLVKKINPFLSSNKLKVTYNIVDFEKWNSDKYSNIVKNSTKIKLIVVSSHQYIKNCKGLIHALAKLTKDDLSRIHVEWYGDEKNDNSFQNSKKLIQEFNLLDKIDFFPAIQNIELQMAKSDIVGLFSFYEGLPNVICEAMSLGKTVISSNVSDIPILLKNENLIFNPNSIQELTAVLHRIINYSEIELDTIGAINKQNAKKFFNKEEIINSYESLLSYKK